MKISGLIFISVLIFSNFAHADDAADLGTILVEASRSNDTVGNMNKDVSIITSQDIANSPAKTLPELLGTVPGVYGTVNSNIHGESVDMGGFGVTSASNTLVLVNGGRINVPDLSGPDLSLIDLNSIDHIEVIQGAGTVLYGDNASGGVINIVTKKGMANTKSTIILSSEVDSYKGNKEGIDLSGGIPKLAYQFNYDRQQSNGFRTSSDYWADDFNTRLNYSPTDIFGIDFTQGYHLDRYSLPGGLTIDQIDHQGPKAALNIYGMADGTTSDSHFDITPHMKFDEGESHFDLSLFTSARKRDNNTEFANGNGTLYEEESYEFQPKFIVTTKLIDRLDNKLTLGYDYIYYREKRRSDGSAPEDIVYSSEATHGVYLLDELTLDQKWLLNTGVRGGWANYIFNQIQQSTSKFNRSATTEGYEGGLGYKYNSDSKIFVNFNHSYRLPVLDEFFQFPYPGNSISVMNAGLTYQEGNQYQLGIKDQTFQGIHLGFIASEAQYKNEIYFDPNTYLNQNYNGRTRHYSEQPEIAVDLFNRKIQPFANVTFQQSKFVKGTYSGKSIPYVPSQLAHAGVIWKPLEGLNTSWTINFVGKRFQDGDQANTEVKLKRYATVDWDIKYNFKNIELWFALRNMLNTRYYTYAVYNSYFPAPGRNVAGGVKIKF